MNLSRRGLFGFGGAAAAVVTAQFAPFGWAFDTPTVTTGYIQLSEIVATTLRNRSGELAEHMMKNNALLVRLNKVSC